MPSIETIIGIGTVIASLSIAGAAFVTVRKDIRTRLRIRHTNDVREKVLEPWLDNLPSYTASSPRGPDGGTESLVAELAGYGFRPYPREVSTALKEHFVEHHLEADAPHELDKVIEKMGDTIQEIRSEKRAYVDEIVDSDQMEEMLSDVNKSWAEVDPKQLAIWLREVYVAEYTGGDFHGEILWMNPEIVENGLKVEEKDGEYCYYPLSEKIRERHQVTVLPVIKSEAKIPEIQVEKLLQEFKRYAEFDFGKGSYNEHIQNAGEAMSNLISNQYSELEQTLEYYSSLPILPHDCYNPK